MNGEEFTLGGAPVKRCPVCIPVGAGECLGYAAAELARMTGSCVRETNRPQAGSFFLSVRSDPARAERFRVYEEKGIFRIEGASERAALYGVYRAAERHFGLRFFTTEWRAREAEILPLDGADWQDAPFFSYRYPLWLYTRDHEVDAKLGVNALYAGGMEQKFGGGPVYAGNMVHTFYDLLPPDRYFAEHPEYYSMDEKGERRGERAQLCLSNPEVLEIAVQSALQKLRETPGANYISVSQNDNFNYCRCPDCARLDEKYGGRQGSLLTFVNAVAREVAKEFPDVFVDTLAYQYSRRPPVGLHPEKNVMIRLCSIEACGNHALDDFNCPQNRAFCRDLRDWSKIAEHLFVWDYVTDFMAYLFPYPNFNVMYRNMKFFADCGVKGVLSQGVHNTKDGEFGELKTYLLAKLMWNPRMRYGEYANLAEEFMREWYGAGYRHIARYTEYLSKHIGNAHFHCYSKPDEILPARLRSDGTPDTGFFEGAGKLFDAAFSEAEREDQRAHVQKSRLHLDYARLYLTMDPLYMQADLEGRAKLEEECKALYENLKKHDIALFKEWGEGSAPDVTCFALSPRDWK